MNRKPILSDVTYLYTHRASIIMLLKLVYRFLIPQLLSFDIKKIKMAMMITKFEFVSYYYIKINKNSKKLFLWIFQNADYLTRKAMIRNFYFSKTLSPYGKYKNFIPQMEKWSEEMKNDKNWKGSLNFIRK